MLETEEAARRLGVKRSTLYAYVSRGLLRSHPTPSGRRSLFDVEEVEQLARRGRGGRATETRLATVTTAVTQVRDDGPYYRGRQVTGLAGTATFEEVTGLLWGTGRRTVVPGEWDVPDLGLAPDLPTADRHRWALVMAGALDPVRADRRPEAVVRAARRLIAALVDVVLPAHRGDAEGSRHRAAELARNHVAQEGTVAARLADRLSPVATPDLVAAVDAALVLLADHELATSTLAVRVAASTRADLYDAVLAGWATLAGPLHGGASRLAHAMLQDAEVRGVEQAVDGALRWQRQVPGFGHPLYEHGDPRAAVLLEHADRLATPSQREVVGALVALAATHDLPPPNVDLGLAAVTWAAGLGPDAGQALFSIARVAGWTAHYLEELGEQPLRFRARAVYAAPR
ncbi:MAG: citrate/2-methylcitrate synthase [Acidimicrobiales bacterium]